MKVAYLTDANINNLADYASWIRRDLNNQPASTRPILRAV
jgi:hypothetical protein